MTFNSNVFFLEEDDVNESGALVHPLLTKGVVVVFVWASWCPHCDRAKPAYQKFADDYAGRVTSTCVQTDGQRPSEQQLGTRVGKVWDVPGYPDYKLFVDGKLQPNKIASRTTEGLEAFVSPFL